MKILIHIGSPKTGTTTLQRTLRGSPEPLAKRGILYPTSALHRFKQQELVAGLGFPGRNSAARYLSPGKLTEIREAYFGELKIEVEKLRPNVLVLSTESLFRHAVARALSVILEGLHNLNPSSIQIAAYIRRPSSHYLSSIQQRIKASYDIPHLRPQEFRSVISAYCEAFGRANVNVRCFDRQQLLQGDIVADFVRHHLEGTGLAREELQTTDFDNATLSAEAMTILRQYRLDHFPEANDTFNQETRQLIRLLRQIDKTISANRPRLRREPADIVDYSSPDPKWLKDEFDVVFPDFDYSLSERGPAESTENWRKPRDLGEILQIEPAIRLKIIEQLRESEWANTGVFPFFIARFWTDGMRQRASHGAWLDELQASR